MSEYTPLLTAILGLIAREAMSVIPAIKEDDASPSKFSFAYYFSRPKNQALLVLNAAGTGILFLARHEVLAISENIPLLSDYLGSGTPLLMCGLIGFAGASVVRYAAKKTDAA